MLMNHEMNRLYHVFKLCFVLLFFLFFWGCSESTDEPLNDTTMDTIVACMEEYYTDENIIVEILDLPENAECYDGNLAQCMDGYSGTVVLNEDQTEYEGSCSLDELALCTAGLSWSDANAEYTALIDSSCEFLDIIIDSDSVSQMLTLGIDLVIGDSDGYDSFGWTFETPEAFSLSDSFSTVFTDIAVLLTDQNDYVGLMYMDHSFFDSFADDLSIMDDFMFSLENNGLLVGDSVASIYTIDATEYTYFNLQDDDHLYVAILTETVVNDVSSFHFIVLYFNDVISEYMTTHSLESLIFDQVSIVIDSIDNSVDDQYIVFNVDMNCVDVAFDSVAISGPFCSWCGYDEENPWNGLVDEDGDGIYSLTLSTADIDTSYITTELEYKYMIDNWIYQEDLVDDMVNNLDCAPVTDYFSYANRLVNWGESTDDVYDTCSGCSDVDSTPNYTVSFDIDGVESCDFVSVTGSWNDFDGWGATTDTSFSIDLEPGSYEYTILCVDTTLSDWYDNIYSNAVVMSPGLNSDCDLDSDDSNYNYSFIVEDQDLSVSICASSELCLETCDDDTEDNTDYSITFDIDGDDDCGYVSVTGEFDDWSGWGAHTDSVPSMTIDVSNGTYEYVVLCVDTELYPEWYNDIWSSSTILRPVVDHCDADSDDGNANFSVTVAGMDEIVYQCADSCNTTCIDTSACIDTYIDDDTDVSVHDIDEMQLVWSEEFNGSSIDESCKWILDYGTGSQYGLVDWGNAELQYYQSDNISVADGVLTITAREESVEDKSYTSGRMNTLGFFDFLYGRIEARIKTPTGVGVWPAFWLLPSQGGWPCNGEIDIMEQWGTEDGVFETTGAAHVGTCDPYFHQYLSWSFESTDSFSDDFHIYTIDWSVDSITFYVDGVETATYENGSEWPFTAYWPFNSSEWYIVLNLAIKPLDYAPYYYTEDDIDALPQSMIVDYIRVYQ